MLDINRHNFLEHYECIQKNIEDARFISIDCEFTGLMENPLFKNSLFDSSNERYKKLKEATQGFIIGQIGVSTFKYIPQENAYEINVYNFQLCPRWYGSDEKILLQPSCLVFLCAHKFDFNEFIYNGISYLNEEDQWRVRRNLHNRTWFRNIEHPFLKEDEELIQKVCSTISRWLQNNTPAEDTLTIPLGWSDDKYVMNYILLYEVLNKFFAKGIYSFLGDNEIHVEKYNIKNSAVLKLFESRRQLQFQLLYATESLAWKSMSGFSEVFKLLMYAKKPIIGHNLLTDLLFMYKQFVKPLPSSLDKFKSEITLIFPQIYDTKYISYEVNSLLDKGQKWNSNGLNDLYIWLRDRTNITHLLLYVPAIRKMQPVSPDSQPKLHQAGWDSYLSGYCFVHLIYILSSLKHNLPTITRPYTLTDQLASVRPLENKINLIRANLNHVNLTGPDPMSQRPPRLHVTNQDRTRIDLDEVTEIFADYGSVDVKRFSYDSALVAVGNHVCLKRAIGGLSRHPKYTVTIYKDDLAKNSHNFGFYTLLIGGAILVYFTMFKHSQPPKWYEVPTQFVTAMMFKHRY